MTDDLKPGRELDALVTEKVMGLTPQYSKVPDSMSEVEYEKYLASVPTKVFSPSTDISDAWQVVEKLREEHKHYPFILTEDRYAGAYSKGMWLASFGAWMGEYEDGPCNGDNEAQDYWFRKDGKIAAGSTPAHAICVAALKAIES